MIPNLKELRLGLFVPGMKTWPCLCDHPHSVVHVHNVSMNGWLGTCDLSGSLGTCSAVPDKVKPVNSPVLTAKIQSYLTNGPHVKTWGLLMLQCNIKELQD